MKDSENKKQVVPVIHKKKKELSKLESLFNFRIRRVKRLKDSLNLASEQVNNYHKQLSDKVFSVSQEIITQQVVLIRELVEAFDANVLKGKKQREKFEKLILFLLENLIFEQEQQGLDDLYKRFAKQTVQEAEQEAFEQESEEFLNMVEFMGVELTEEEKEKVRKNEMDSEFMEEMEKRINQRNDETSDFFSNFNFQPRKKTKQQLEREKREAEELENISKTVKKVYKELVVELHPDKESDEAKRAEKTALMQEITEAYRNDDLFTLLSIQLAQIQGVDNQDLSDEKINYFNTMLLNQARELEKQKWELARNQNLPYELYEALGKKQFDTLANKLINTEKQFVKQRLGIVKEQLVEVKAKNKDYIKNFVEENYSEIFEEPPFPSFSL